MGNLLNLHVFKWVGIHLGMGIGRIRDAGAGMVVGIDNRVFSMLVVIAITLNSEVANLPGWCNSFDWNTLGAFLWPAYTPATVWNS